MGDGQGESAWSEILVLLSESSSWIIHLWITEVWRSVILSRQV